VITGAGGEGCRIELCPQIIGGQWVKPNPNNNQLRWCFQCILFLYRSLLFALFPLRTSITGATDQRIQSASPVGDDGDRRWRSELCAGICARGPRWPACNQVVSNNNGLSACPESRPQRRPRSGGRTASPAGTGKDKINHPVQASSLCSRARRRPRSFPSLRRCSPATLLNASSDFINRIFINSLGLFHCFCTTFLRVTAYAFSWGMRRVWSQSVGESQSEPKLEMPDHCLPALILNQPSPKGAFDAF